MSSKGLYTSALDALDPRRMQRTHTVEGAEYLSAPPTNEQILDAARLVYHQHVDVVDSHTQCGIKYVGLADGQAKVAALNAYDWTSKQAAPITPTAGLVHAAPTLQPAVKAAHDDPDVWSLVIGISESAQFVVGEEGGVGVAFALDNTGDSKGEGYFAGKLGFDVEVSINLNLGIWNAPPAKLSGGFWGLQVNLDLEVGVSLGILMSGDQLQYMGFSVGVGVGVGGGATIVGGYTWLF